MVSGSDMHGTPITVTAQQEGKAPEEVAMHYHKINSKSIEDMGISFDLFSHTHTEEHTEAALWILETLDKAGHIEPQCRRSPTIPKPSNSYLIGTLRVLAHIASMNLHGETNVMTVEKHLIPRS